MLQGLKPMLRGLIGTAEAVPSSKHDVTSYENDVTFNEHAVPSTSRT
jgi:hypothetical protein